jgi:hypothetical protein
MKMIHFQASVINGMYEYRVVDRVVTNFKNVPQDKYSQQLVKNGEVVISFSVPSVETGIAQFYGNAFLGGKTIPYFWTSEIERLKKL